MSERNVTVHCKDISEDGRVVRGRVVVDKSKALLDLSVTFERQVPLGVESLEEAGDWAAAILWDAVDHVAKATHHRRR